MHTSKLVLFLFLAAFVLTALAQVMNYLSIDRASRTPRRKAALALGLAGVIVAAVSGYLAAVDWAALPKSPDGLRAGQLWNDGGIPAIAQ